MDEAKDEVQKDPVAEHPSTPTVGAPGTPTCAAQLSSAAEALERVIGKLEAQYEALNQKIDRIIATVEKLGEEKEQKAEVAANAEGNPLLPTAGRDGAPAVRVHAERKTLPAVVSTLLAKSGVSEGPQMDSSTLDRALGGLTIEQRIAVKAELARAGMLA